MLKLAPLEKILWAGLGKLRSGYIARQVDEWNSSSCEEGGGEGRQ